MTYVHQSLYKGCLKEYSFLLTDLTIKIWFQTFSSMILC